MPPPDSATRSTEMPARRSISSGDSGLLSSLLSSSLSRMSSYDSLPSAVRTTCTFKSSTSKRSICSRRPSDSSAGSTATRARTAASFSSGCVEIPLCPGAASMAMSKTSSLTFGSSFSLVRPMRTERPSFCSMAGSCAVTCLCTSGPRSTKKPTARTTTSKPRTVPPTPSRVRFSQRGSPGRGPGFVGSAVPTLLSAIGVSLRTAVSAGW